MKTNRVKYIKVCSHNLRLDITEISNNCYSYELDDEMLNFKIMDKLVLQLKAEKTSGEFIVKTRIGKTKDSKGKLVQIKGQWRIHINYSLFYRIYRWWYNCNIDPQEINKLFLKAFERDAQLCIEQFEKDCNRNIFDFIGFLGTHYRYGNAFMDMINKQMQAYEKKYSLPPQ
ncbi:MAG: hypothetical protein ACK5KL_05165 [Dysgonomonas sp.]